MNTSSPNSVPNMCKCLKRLLVLASAVSVLLLGAQPAETGEEKKMSQVEAAVEQFRDGVRYQPPPTAFLQQGQLLEQELELFGPALRQESGPVREQIIRLLEDAGIRSCPLFHAGEKIIRQPRIIAMLVVDGLVHDDLGREAALSTLQQYVPAESLKPYESDLTNDLKERPSTTAFLLIAKAKPAGAVPVVRKLMAAPRWQKELKARVAAAALGDKGIEKEFIASFQETKDPKDKASLAKILGWVGTDAALRALADALRTDLVIEMPHVSRRSVRLDVLAALCYNFPDQQALYERQLQDDSGYERAEAFCVQRFGTKWDQPRPPFLKVMGFPNSVPNMQKYGKRMEKHYLMLSVIVVGVRAEVYVNDIPLGLYDPVKSPSETQPVNQYLVDGKNEVAVVIEPGPTPSQSQSLRREEKLAESGSIQIQLTQYPEGVFPGSSSGQELLKIEWSADAGQTVTVPIRQSKIADLGRMYGVWQWQTAPRLDLSTARVAEVQRLLQQLVESLQRGDGTLFVSLAGVKFEENGRAYGLGVGERKEKWRDDLAEMAGEKDWRVLPVAQTGMDLRLCAGGRMIECIGRDWMPVLRANPDAEGLPTVRYPIFLADIGGKLQIVR
ncbi:MAG: hypothetical protein A2219_08235 [Elusimicrobia bacterium RIFOXYA2_FULL_50_26]|nr:MAG: hypothetical protein A2219_08235 [Elusimicrobia bacterium RIFOXYA2_FULL_50_26]OGS25308.1 MAG: hypothetical protein A2314_00840 [Elusimicrobia bacterium RIFOXYB2_FULL_50_12]